LSDEQRTSLGIHEDVTDLSDLGASAISRFGKLLDVASVVTSGNRLNDKDSVFAELTKLSRGEYETVIDNDGGFKTVLRSTPAVVKDALGYAKPMRPFDAGSAEAAAEYYKTSPLMAAARETIKIGGLVPDQTTKLDGTMAVTYRDASGTEQKFALPVTSPDRPTIVDARWVQPGGLLHGAVEVLSTDEASGTASVKVDFPEEGNDSQSIVLDERSELRFNPRNSTWELRYIDRGEGVQTGFMDTVRGALEAIGLTTPREEVTRTLQGLTEDQRKAWSRAVANKDPRFWSDEQLRRRGMAKATDEVAAEVRRRQEGGKRMTIDEVTSVRPGMGVKAQDGDTFTPTASEMM
jgi:hypothetical protein